MSCRPLGQEKFWSVMLSEDETDPLVTCYILCFQRRDDPGIMHYVSSIQVRIVVDGQTSCISVYREFLAIYTAIHEEDGSASSLQGEKRRLEKSVCVIIVT